MTEKEKCERGLLYDANYDNELMRDAKSARTYARNTIIQNILTGTTEI